MDDNFGFVTNLLGGRRELYPVYGWHPRQFKREIVMLCVGQIIDRMHQQNGGCVFVELHAALLEGMKQRSCR